MTKIAVFLPNWLGDVAMATPVLRALRKHFGADAQIVGIMRPYLRDVLGGTDWLSEQWYFDPKDKQPEFRRLALIRRMQATSFDTAILLPNSFSSALTAWRGGARRRVGYVRYGRGLFLTDRLYPPRRNGRRVEEPAVDYFLRLAETVGCPAESRRLELRLTPAEEALGDRVWRDLGLRTDGRVVALNCSGAYGGAKLWPVEHFGLLARRIVAEWKHDVLVICGPRERVIARDIVRHSGMARVHSLADQPIGISTSKACLARCRLLVSTDSGPRHVAAALGRPVVTLYGPMLPVASENPTQQAANLYLDLDCIGCHKRVCPLGHHRCMRDLTVDMVYNEMIRLMEADDAAAAA
ncbi:MAG: lipopolysaccharide heptosyltransferase II [Pirellulales bacterium]|nr:lipopolysaccharide heptosyltransferase II [Pirellulales bacterium]